MFCPEPLNVGQNFLLKYAVTFQSLFSPSFTINRIQTRLDKPILNSAQLKNEEHFNLLITFILNEVQPTSNFPHLKIKFDLPLKDSSLPFASFTWLAQPPSPPSHSPLHSPIVSTLTLPSCQCTALSLSLSKHEQEIHTPCLLILFSSNSSLLPGYFSLSLTLTSCQCTGLSLSLQA